MSKEEIKKIVKMAIEKGPLSKEIKKVSLFGSYQKELNNKDSDIDLLVEFMPTAKIGFFKFVGLQEHLENALGKNVDLLTPESLSKYFKDQILNTAEAIYER